MVKRLLYSIALMLLATLPVAAQYISDDKSNDFVFYYDSYDGQKNKAKLSCRVFYSKEVKTIKHVLISCHPTTTSNESVPSGPRPLDDAFSKRMCGEADGSYLIVCPDYCGYGVSSHYQHPYLIHDVTARNCFDALLPAIQAAKDHGIKFESSTKLSLDIVGYSQGGATALACAKLFDSDACPEEIQRSFDLRQTCCGDGPYSIFETLKQYMEWGKPSRPDGGLDLAYPCVLPLIVAAAKEAYNDGCMRTVEVEDFFNPDFLATGILEDLKTKNVGTGLLNTKVEQAMPRRRPVDILSRNIIQENGDFNTATKEYKCFMRAMELADLCTGWRPKHRITFYHIAADDVVPYVNYSKGIMGSNGIGTLYTDNVRSVSPSEIWTESIWSGLMGMLQSGYDVDPDWNNMKHDVGGTYFYASYMFGKYIRYRGDDDDGFY